MRITPGILQVQQQRSPKPTLSHSHLASKRTKPYRELLAIRPTKEQSLSLVSAPFGLQINQSEPTRNVFDCLAKKSPIPFQPPEDIYISSHYHSQQQHQTAARLTRLLTFAHHTDALANMEQLIYANRQWLTPMLGMAFAPYSASQKQATSYLPARPLLWTCTPTAPSHVQLSLFISFACTLLQQSQCLSAQRSKAIRTLPTYLHGLKLSQTDVGLTLRMHCQTAMANGLMAIGASGSKQVYTLGNSKYDLQQLCQNPQFLAVFCRCLRADAQPKQVGMLLVSLCLFKPSQQIQASRLLRQSLSPTAPQAVALHMLYLLKTWIVCDPPQQLRQRCLMITQLSQLTSNPTATPLCHWYDRTPTRLRTTLINHLHKCELKPCSEQLLYRTLQLLQHYQSDPALWLYLRRSLQGLGASEQQCLLSALQTQQQAGQNVQQFCRQVYLMRHYFAEQLPMATIVQLAATYPHAPIARIAKGLSNHIQQADTIGFAIACFSDPSHPIEKACRTISYLLTTYHFQQGDINAMLDLVSQFPHIRFEHIYKKIERHHLTKEQQLVAMYRLAQTGNTIPITTKTTEYSLSRQRLL